MIVVDRVFAKGTGRPKPLLNGATLRWESGLLSVVGAPLDGTSLLCACLAGQTATKRGVIAIDGRAPEQGREDVAWVPLEPVLPESMRVHEVIALAAEIRGDQPISLSSLGLEKLADRRVPSLSVAEARGVLLALALGSRATTLVIEEPLSNMEGARHVAPLLRERAKTSTIVTTTGSVRDATTLGGSLAVMTKGLVSPVQGALRHELRVIAKNAEALAAAIGDDEAVNTFTMPNTTTLSVVGSDLSALAAAVNRAAANARIVVDLVEPVVATLDELRAFATRAPA